MNTIYENLNVICRDESNTYKILECSGYDESIDEIKIRTVVKNNELKRGWIGDLSYSTGKSIDILTADYVDFVVEDTYQDVLLRSVNIWTIDDGIITWEYTFLKK